MMKRGTIIGGVMLGLALSGYGAWCMYKKMSPEGASNMKKNMRNMTKDMEKSIENMM